MTTRKTVASLSSNPRIHQFLTHHIEKSGLTQREIAKACGFGRPNMVSMLKTGDTRMPLERLGAMADVLKVDAYDLFVLWMKTYYGGTWDVLRKHIAKRSEA